MSNSLYETLREILITLTIGMVLGVIGDIFSLTALIKDQMSDKIYKLIKIFQDLGFVILFSLTLIITLYYLNDGVFRGLYFSSLILGIFLYNISLSKITKKTILFILSLIAKFVLLCARIIRTIVGFLLIPIAKLFIILYNHIINNNKGKEVLR